MSINDEEIVFTIDAKRLIAIAMLAILTVATLSSYIIALLAWVAPDNSYLTKVTDIDTYDSGDTQKSTFSRGSVIRVKATVEKATAYNSPSYTVISESSNAEIFLIVYYIDGSTVTPLKYSRSSTTLSPGVPYEAITQFVIPSNAPTSGVTYLARCIVWSSTLPGGDTLADPNNFLTEQQVTFSVS